MTAARWFVFGDIHGCLAEVDRLIEHLAPTPNDTLIFLGDYIDRGLQSKGVIDRLVRLKTEGPRCVFLKGNHEDMFLAYAGRRGSFGEMFLPNGGAATLRSYAAEGKSGSALWQQLPPEHQAFFESLELTHEVGPYICVHAGFSPRRALGAQVQEDMLWIRDEWVRSRHAFGRTVLFGHTPRRNVLVDWPYKIGLDTACVYGNKLSCLELTSGKVMQIQLGGQMVTMADVQRTVIQTGATWPRFA